MGWDHEEPGEPSEAAWAGRPGRLRLRTGTGRGSALEEGRLSEAGKNLTPSGPEEARVAGVCEPRSRVSKDEVEESRGHRGAVGRNWLSFSVTHSI